MSIENEPTYINLISSRLRNFKKKSKFLWCFSCPLCGDSDKDKRKARGYIYRNEGKLSYKCHNCGFSSSFQHFLKVFDSDLYSQYRIEKLGDSHKRFETKTIKSVYVPKKRKIDLVSIYELDNNHEAKKYCINRQVPIESLKRIYYSPDFHRFIDSNCRGKYNFKTDERIVFPLMDIQGNLIGAQGRVFYDSDPKFRFITCSFGDDVPLCFGLNDLDLIKKIYVVEGSFDSLFLPNCIAVLSSGLSSVVKSIREFYNISFEYVLVHDNEPRNKEIVEIVKRSLISNKVCMWPSTLKFKDINDMVLNGIDPKSIIDQNSFDYPINMMKFSNWSKIKFMEEK